MLKSEFNRRERASEAARQLNEFIMDFVVGTRALEIFEQPQIQPRLSDRLARGLNQMAMTHIVIALAKWVEFYREYKAILPRDVRGACKTIYKEIKRRKIPEFRNAVVAHLKEKQTGRPLSSVEINRRYIELIEDDPDRFRLWVNNPKDNSFPNTVVGVTEYTRDRLMSEYGLSNQEIVK